jgi:FixJ family two-component response regulator
MEPSVYFIDDDLNLRRALLRLLHSYGYKAKSYASAKEFLNEKIPDSPACLILDLKMPEIDGLAVQNALAQDYDHLQVIFLSGRGDITTSVRAMKAGAVDFLTKPVDGQKLDSAIRIALQRAAKFVEKREASKKDRDAFNKLTPRERDVCLRIAQGLLNKQVGFELGTSEKTIKAQRAHVMQKLGASSLADVVRLVERLRSSGGIPVSSVPTRSSV